MLATSTCEPGLSSSPPFVQKELPCFANSALCVCFALWYTKTILSTSPHSFQYQTKEGTADPFYFHLFYFIFTFCFVLFQF